MSNIDLGLDMASLDTGLRQTTITGVIVHAGASDSGETVDYTAGNATGNVLEVSIPDGTQRMAQSILDGIRKRGFRYLPFESGNTITDPAIEIGDNVTVRGVPSVVMGIGLEHARLLAPTLKAPYDEELDHEFKYEPRMEREFRREVKYSRSRLTLNADAITAEVVRASNSEGELSGRLQITADAITAEVTRASAAEGSLSSRITQTASEISSEVTRATAAEGSLSTRITQTADDISAEVSRAGGAETSINARIGSLTLKVSGDNGTSTFRLNDGSADLTATSFDLYVKNTNIVGKLTVGQISSGAVVVSSKSNTQYYLSTSSSSATGSSAGWIDTVPEWVSGKFVWTRTKTTVTKNSASGETPQTTTTYSDGVYDQNLTSALETATAAGTAASGAQTAANGAVSEQQTVYRSMSGGTPPPNPTTWVTDATGNQNTWTLVRPVYQSNYPALYIATQKRTVGGTVTYTTPRLDATTTVIDGSHITTGTIDAARINVNGDLSAFGASIAGWKINSTYLTKTNGATDAESTMRVRINAPANPTSSSNAVSIATRETVNDTWDTQFAVTYGGVVTANKGVFKGDVSAGNIKYGTSGGVSHGYMSGSGLSSGTVGTTQFTGGVNGSLGYADFSNDVFNNLDRAEWGVFKNISVTNGFPGKHSGSWDDSEKNHSVSWNSRVVVTGITESSAMAYVYSGGGTQMTSYVNVPKYTATTTTIYYLGHG